MLDLSRRVLFDESLDQFRDIVRQIFARHLLPHQERWERAGIVDRDIWRKCGEAGLRCPQVPEEYGGLGLDFRYNAVVCEELFHAGSTAGLTLQSDHERVSDRAAAGRRAGAAYLWRHQRDHEGSGRPRALTPRRGRETWTSAPAR